MAPISPQFAFRPPTAPTAPRPLSYDGTEPPPTAVTSQTVSFQVPPPTSQSDDLSSPPSSSRAQSAHRSGTQSSGLSGSSFWSSSKDTKNISLSDPVFLAVKQVSFDGSQSPAVTEVEAPVELVPKETAAEPESENDDPDEDSPYPEVRASVSNTDDPDMPCLTFRVFLLSVLIGLVFNAANTFFYLRYPAAYLTSPTIVLAGYLGGKALEKLLPIRSWEIAGHEFSLNPGPFNVKEHTMIFLAGGISLDTGPAPWGLAVVIVWDKMYHQELRKGFSYLFLLSAQLMGLGLSGLSRSLFVDRADAIWPTNLSICAMLNTLHAGEDADGFFKGPSRLRLFAFVVPLAGLWMFLPGFLFTALSYFSVICWIWPNNAVVNQVFGSVTGLGLGLISLDWSQIAYMGSPLTMPFWAQLHVFGAFVLFYWILLPILYYSNVWKSAHLPIMGSAGYDRFAKPYDVSRVLDLQTLRLNETAYDEYSPLYLPISFGITYTLAWTIPPALLMQTIFIFGPVVYRAIRGRPKPGDYVTDIHSKLMKRYPEVPKWWHGAAFIVGLGFATGTALFQPSLHIPLPAVYLAVLLAAIWIIPDCYIISSTGQSVAINLLVQTIPGVLWQGEPLTNMVFKVYCIMTMSSGGVFAKGFKLGHYMKIPPKYTFFAQFFGILIGNAWQILIQERLFAAIPDMCEPDQHARLTCPQSRVFYTSSIVWGLIGPTRQFGKGAIYYGPVYASILGAILPILVWLWNRRYPFTFMRKFNVAVALNGPTGIPPATGINYSSWFLVGVIFQWYLRTRRYRWWARYNYVLAGALDTGKWFSSQSPIWW
ncbi:hypothetical protein M407DRAFT_29192 [Tulasnella calospora MUT 4182]|uniref:OPT superfamily oligopeptide transporter n=1 Tax=Tulasnella calospora MUT 4182 TaxID=1051891 RepID=A0A0C3PZZ6_9AGAM|nr:hypothetical protein M407DRAFT_29192 [Tulasnella calospora MUT 4182]